MIVRQVLNRIPIHSLKSSERMSETYCERLIVRDLIEMKHSRISSSLLEQSLYDGCVYGRAFSSGMKLFEVVSNRVS